MPGEYIFCKGCGKPIAKREEGKIIIKYKGRLIEIEAAESLHIKEKCENCKTVTEIDEGRKE